MSQEVNVSHASTWLLKIVGGVIGGIATQIFPTQALMNGLLCYGVAFAIDTVTGISAAIYEKTPVTVSAFIGKAGKKLVQAVAYIGLAWIASKLITDTMQLKAPVAEPMGFVLAILVMTDALSVIRNLSRAHNNIPILDRLFRRLMNNLRETVEPAKEEERVIR